MPSLRATLASNLKALRYQREFSQEDLAAAANIDRTYVSALERAKYAASVDMLERLAKALGVPAADLLRRDLQ